MKCNSSKTQNRHNYDWYFNSKIIKLLNKIEIAMLRISLYQCEIKFKVNLKPYLMFFSTWKIMPI